MRRRHLLFLPVLAGLMGACAGTREYKKEDTWITDCDTLTQEVARITDDMTKDDVQRILGFESWLLQATIDGGDVYRQSVVYNYNANCEKLRGKNPPSARRRIMVEYENMAVARVVDTYVNQNK